MYKNSATKSCWKSTKTLIVDYANHSTVHGVSYIVEKGRSWFERIWWVAVLCISALCCGKLIFDAWNISPIIITFTEKPTPIWQIPFPAVTICPKQVARWNLTQIFQRKANGVMIFDNLTEAEKLQTIAKFIFCVEPVRELMQNYTDCNQCLETFRNMKISPEEIFFNCKFQGQAINCTESFKESINGFKLCYTFNGLDMLRRRQDRIKAEEWSIGGGYRSTASFYTYPHRSIGAGTKFGLSFLLRSDMAYFDPLCSAAPGFLLEYHMPHEAPQFETKQIQIPMDDSLLLSVTPKMISTSDELRHYSVYTRKCYFTEERRLKYYVEYTQSNCMLDCITDLVLERCGCLAIAMEYSNDFDICGPSQNVCFMMTKDFLVHQSFLQCKCWPACSSIVFESEVSVAKLNMSTLVRGNGQTNFQYSQVKIYMQESYFTTLKRSKLYGPTDFLANCGGLMGLCLGISVISLLEMVYFCLIRSWCCRSANGDAAKVEIQSTRSYLKVVQKLIVDYFTRTTIQGVKYVANTNLSRIDRIWWMIVVVLSTICCGSLVFDVFRQYDQSPVIISYENEEKPITQIPFPAVTICPQVVSVYVGRMFDYFKVKNYSLYHLDEDSIKEVTAVAQVCEPDVFLDVDPDNRTNCEFCSHYLKKSMGRVASIFDLCSHLKHDENCSQIFSQLVTESGVCFVYNSFGVYRNLYGTSNANADRWTLEDGFQNYPGQVDNTPLPGVRNPLYIRMSIPKYMNDGLCKDAIQAFKVYLHLPNEAPQILKHFSLAPYQHYSEIFINPRVTVTAPELRDLPVAKRQCYFSDERALRFYRHYTQNNCENECVVNLTLATCGCLLFHMPKILGVKYCGISDQKCHRMIVEQIAAGNVNENHSFDCHCLPTCVSISYDTEVNNIFLTDYILQNHFRYKSDVIERYSFVQIEIFFRESQFIALKRSQLFGKIELLANCGGLVGLFLGFSFISVLELLYFCTIRMFCDLRRAFQ